MMGLTLSRRARWGLIGIFLFALVAFFPMRLAFGLLGVDRYGISAHDIRGSVWVGRISQLILGEVPLGTVRAGLSPIQLFVLRARLDVARSKGLPDDIKGALSAGPGRYGIDDVTGALPLGAATAPLPIAAVDMQDVTAHFAQGRCAGAEGQVRAKIAGDVPGLNLSQGLSGTARCEGDALVLPMVSQSGLEKLTVRLSGNGRYLAEMRISTSDPALAQTLGAAGFAQGDGDSVLRIEGTM